MVVAIRFQLECDNMSVFLVFAVLLVPAAVICWPQPYAQLLSLPNCASALTPKPFTPIEYTGKGITYNPDNKKYHVLIFYRLERQEDAERIVGALRLAGYDSDDGIASTLDEVTAPDKHPGMTLVKTTTFARPIVDEVSEVVRRAIPVKAPSVSLFKDDAPLQKGHVQIDLF
jgi:hypothetical protein